MRKTLLTISLLAVGSIAKPIVFSDYGAIWICKGDFWVSAQRGAKTVRLSSDSRKIDVPLHYDATNDIYRSSDNRHTLHFDGDSLESGNVHFRIDGQSLSCYYEYMENG